MDRSDPNETERSDETRFAAQLGVAVADIAAVECAFVSMMSKIGVDGQKIFDALRRGESFASALRVPPQAIPLLYARAHSWFAIGRTDKAALLFRALCALAGDVADHWVGYGVCLKKEKKFLEAERAFLEGAARRPSWAVPYFHLTETYLRLGDRTRALQASDAYEERVDESTPDLLDHEAHRFRSILVEPVEAASPLEAAVK